MRICVLAQLGWGNCGDEGILQAIIDDLGWENEFIVQTSLPFTRADEYYQHVPFIADVRPLEDSRLDFDVLLLGGGKVDWGFGWQKIFSAYEAKLPLMAYGIAVINPSLQLNTQAGVIASEKLEIIYGRFYDLFNRVTVRDMDSEEIMKNFAVNVQLSMCPAINLKEEKVSCPENMIAVCPRYQDFDAKGVSHNEDEVNWIVEQVKDEADNVLLIPFNPVDMQGNLRDLQVCKDIMKRLNYRCKLLEVDPYKPRQVKYAISKSKLVISGGRYHALVWAAAHNVPFLAYPNATTIVALKMDGFLKMHEIYGSQLRELAKNSKKTFEELFNE